MVQLSLVIVQENSIENEQLCASRYNPDSPKFPTKLFVLDKTRYSNAFFQQLQLWCIPSEPEMKRRTWGGEFTWKIIRFDPCTNLFIVRKFQKHLLSDISIFNFNFLSN